MRQVFTFLTALFILATANGQGFSRAEYFFDTDPGAGNGTPIALSGTSDTINFNAAISTASLPGGFHFLAIRVQHNTGIWSQFDNRGFYISDATTNTANITAAEYFFDADPGAGNGTALSVGASGSTVNFTAVIPTSLTQGFHFLAIRTRDANGIWSLFEIRGFYISDATLNTANIVDAEYFFDADPGIGNGTPLSVGASGSTVNFTAVIPTSLSPGFHFLAIRTKDANGIWGLYDTRGFYISTASTDAGNIVAAEYFIDSDPGVGLGTPLSVGSSGATVNFTAAIPTSLPEGFHFIAIRVKNTDGTWGHFDKRGFYISTATADAGNVVAAEYFIDTDPGPGLATPASIGASGATVNFTVSIPTSLSTGFHFLAIRTKNTDGIWGHYEKRGFYISAATADMQIITDAEYFFDADPGIGNGTPLTITTPGNIVIQTFSVPVPGTMSNGQHFLSIRVKDQSGFWGLYDYDTLNIGVSTLTCPANATATTATGACTAVVNGLDPTITPPQSFNYTFSGATTSTGNGTATGQSFNAGTTTVVYALTNSPTVTCSFTVIVTAVPLTITTQPTNQTVCEGANVSFTVAATGTNLNYQWRKNGVNITGATSSTFTINGVVAADADNYDVLVSNSCNPGIASSVAALTVNTAPSISTQPASQVVCTGGNVTFNVTASGTALTFQWRKGGVNISGATNSSFTISNVSATDAGNYDVVITGTCGSLNSTTATLTVNAGSSITTQPASQTVCEGANVTFSVVAGGTGLTYQWRKGGVNITGATSTSFTISNVTAADAGNYDVVVTASCGNLISNIATLTVNTTTAIVAQPTSLTVCPGTNAAFTVTASGNNLTYQWRKAGVNISGATASTFTINNVTSTDAGSYDVVVTGSCGNATSSSVSLVVNITTAITTQPVSQTVCNGANVAFSVAANGTALTFQWRFNGTNITGANASTLNLANVNASNAGNYDVVVSGACGTVTSSVATLAISAPTSITTQPVSQAVCAGTTANFSVTATGSNLTYQWRKSGVNITGATASTLSITNASAADAGNYDVIVTGSCGTVTSTTVVLTINAQTVIVTQPSAQTVCAGAAASFSVSATGTGTLSYQWRKNGVNIGGATSSTFGIAATTTADAGNYDVIVTGLCGSVTSTSVSLVVNAATSITTQPQSQSGCTGSNISFTVTATGGSLTYQWRKNGANITGATTTTLTINNVTLADAGNYDVIVSGTCGNVTSNIAILSLNQATSITTQPVSQSVCEGSNINFNVAALGTSLTFQWRKDGVNINLATSSTLNLSNVTPSSAGSYDVVVTGACGAVTSANVQLTVSANGTWLGTTSSDWNNPSNWCGGVPGSTSDVTIPSSAPNMPNLIAAGTVRNVTINNGATVTISSGGTLDLFGNISGSGTFNATTGNLNIVGPNNHSIPGFTVNNLTLNGNIGATITGDVIVNGALTLTNGHINIGNNNLAMAGSSNGSIASHIVTGGSGTVILRAVAASTTRTAPVGFNATTYNPVVINANAGHVTDDISIRIAQDVLNQGTTGNPFTNKVVDKTWFISEANNGGSNVNLTLQWNGSQELTLFNRSRCYIMQFNGTTWVAGNITAASGTDPFTQTKTNVTSFSTFAVQSQPYNLGRYANPQALGVYPNPVSRKLNVVFELLENSTVTFKFYDSKGRLMKEYSTALSLGLNDVPIDVSSFAGGIYFLKVYTNTIEKLMVATILKY